MEQIEEEVKFSWRQSNDSWQCTEKTGWGNHNHYCETTLWQGLRMAPWGWRAGFRSQRRMVALKWVLCVAAAWMGDGRRWEMTVGWPERRHQTDGGASHQTQTVAVQDCSCQVGWKGESRSCMSPWEQSKTAEGTCVPVVRLLGVTVTREHSVLLPSRITSVLSFSPVKPSHTSARGNVSLFLTIKIVFNSS